MLNKLNDYLKLELNARRLRNRRYSTRKFAKDLNISAAVMSRILNNKITVSKRILETISKKIDIPYDLSKQVLNQTSNRVKQESQIKYLTIDQIKLIKSWYFSAVCEAITLPKFNQDTQWLAKKLCISKDSIDECIEFLFQCDLIKLDKTGQLLLSHKEISSLAIGPTKLELMNLQEDFFKNSTMQIKTCRIEERDHSTIVMSMDRELIDDVKLRIKKFRRELATHIEKKSADNKNSVYQLSIGFSPLIKL